MHDANRARHAKPQSLKSFQRAFHFGNSGQFSHLKSKNMKTNVATRTAVMVSLYILPSHPHKPHLEMTKDDAAKSVWRLILGVGEGQGKAFGLTTARGEVYMTSIAMGEVLYVQVYGTSYDSVFFDLSTGGIIL